MKFGCVVVTYNRLEKLKITLESYDKQLEENDTLIVVDNGSNQDTVEYLKKWEKTLKKLYRKIYIRMDENNGGAFGFKKGLEAATEENLEWCMISDDDAYLGENFIKNCKKHIKEQENKYGVICSKVIYPDGKIQNIHRRYLKKGILEIKEIESLETDYSKEEFDINLFSFVGVCINMRVIKEVGYPDERYFIWYDDTDLSIRINEKFKIGCFTDLVMIHDCDKNGSDGRVTFKEYYGYRNRLITLKKYYGPRYYRFYLLLLRLRCISNAKKCPERVTVIKDSIYGFYNNDIGKNKKYLPNTFNIAKK